MPGDISDFGHDSSLTLGISLALSLGFTNIIMTGIDLAKDRASDSWAHHRYDTSPTDDESKSERYPKLIDDFDRIATYAHSVGALIYASSEITTLPGAVHIPADIIIKNIYSHIDSGIPLTNSGGTGLSADDRGVYTALKAKVRTSRILSRNVIGIADKLFADIPELFDTPPLREAKKKLDIELATAKCTNCTKDRIGRPFFDVFIEALRSRNEKVLTAWGEYMPDIMVALVDGNTIFSPKHIEDKQLLSTLEGKRKEVSK